MNGVSGWLKNLVKDRKRLTKYVFFFNLILVLAVFSSFVFVAAAEATQTNGVFQGDKFVGAGIAVAGSTLGAGIALFGTASSGFAAIVEKSELATWLLLIAGLGEGVAIYGLIIAIMILGA
jgi:V/A-type H+-transporting ATPase subunit K